MTNVDSRSAGDVPSTVEERIAGWSLYAPWLQEDSVTHWAELREQAPIVRSAEHGGYWILSRFEDIEWAARNPDIFSAAQTRIPYHKMFAAKEIPVELDGEDHRQWRQALADVFGPAPVTQLAPEIAKAAVEAIEPIAARGDCEFISELGVPLPFTAFLIVFGIGSEYLREMMDHKSWLRKNWANAKSDAEIFAANRPLWQLFGDAIDRRRQEGFAGRPDVISGLLRARINDRPLEQDEMINIIFMSLLASLDTTTSALGMTFRYLATHPEVRRLVTEAPERLPVLIEELLRYEPVVTTARLVTRDVERHGVTMRQGDKVLMSWGMAGRDPAIFNHPGEVDLDRGANRHLAFGMGPHRCLGMHIARRIVNVTLTEWHTRIPHYRLAEGHQPTHHYLAVRGLNELRLVWDREKI